MVKKIRNENRPKIFPNSRLFHAISNKIKILERLNVVTFPKKIAKKEFVTSPSRPHIASLHEAHATSILHLNRIDPLHAEEEPQQRALRGATIRARVC